MKHLAKEWSSRLGRKRSEPAASDAVGAAEHHFEEISLDSRKRKITGANASHADGHQSCTNRIMGMDSAKFVCVLVLFTVNLLNYMDRFTVAGVLTDLQDFYGIDDSWAGFLQTVFIIFFMSVAPVCGFLGDRFNRKRIMLVGLSIWVGAVLASSFIPSGHFYAFVLLRGLVGVGEASYAVIAPTLIADLFAGRLRSRVLMFFYFAIPVGSGLGYVVGASVTSLAKGDSAAKCASCWQWGIRVTPVLGALCILTLLLFVKEPQRGQAEREASGSAVDSTSPVLPVESAVRRTHTRYQSGHLSVNNNAEVPQQFAWSKYRLAARHHLASYANDILYLAANRTFVWSTIGYTAEVFVTGTLTWWGPAAVEHATADRQHLNDTSLLDKGDKGQVSQIFGAITLFAGILGVGMGTMLSQMWKQGKFCCVGRASPKADPLICAIGSFAAVPLMFISLQFMGSNMLLAWVIIFLTIVCLCLNWAVNVDMLMSIIVPERRSSASAAQILVSHLFGDASGPYLVGALSDVFRHRSTTPGDRFRALVYAFYLPNALLVVGGAAFMAAAYTLPTALRKVEEHAKQLGAKEHDRLNTTNVGGGLNRVSPQQANSLLQWTTSEGNSLSGVEK